MTRWPANRPAVVAAVTVEGIASLGRTGRSNTPPRDRGARRPPRGQRAAVAATADEDPRTKGSAPVEVEVEVAAERRSHLGPKPPSRATTPALPARFP